jgi:RNA polymerase sigma-70 factor (ECF subfamily)
VSNLWSVVGLGREDIAELFGRYAPIVHRRALFIVGRDADAWDVVQEVFERMLASSAEFRAEARPMTWVYRITTNVALNAVRARGLREPDGAESGAAFTADLARTLEARQMLHKLSASLDERELSVVAMTVLDGLTQEEIADALGLSRKTIGGEIDGSRAKVVALGFEPFTARGGT